MDKNKLLSVVLALCISGCGHKNPMLNEESIGNLRSYYFAGYNTFDEFYKCPKYWAGITVLSQTLQKKCDAQLKIDYDTLKNDHRRDILSGASFEDFSDKNFWKKYVTDY